MTRVLVLLLALASACKDKGTITIDLENDACGGTKVWFQAIKNGTCSCTCGACECSTSTTQQCITTAPCLGGCSIESVRADGIEFEPPSAGQYALTYKFTDDATPARTTSIVCVIVDVDADGTTSTTTTPEPPACCL
ncbi:MAG: hypothetical protein IPQ07_43470 [Myxococcales bacterium]|nr:hypothetical protein [Myxococcales bacterium]